MTTLESINRNIEALTELIEAIKENKTPSQDILNKYVGFGNIKEILFDPLQDELWKSESLQNRVLDFHTLIKENFPEQYENIIRSIQSSTLTSFYTPSQIVSPLTRKFSDYFEANKIEAKVLDPSSGTGAFITDFKNDNAITSIVAIEKDPLSAAILKQRHNNNKTTVLNIPFEHLTQQDFIGKQKYDLITSNIPFGDFKVYDKDFNREPNDSAQYRSMNSIHGYFFMKSIELLNPNGYIAFITSTGIADSTKNAYIREELIRKCELIDAKRLPNHCFVDAGTKVVSDLLIFKRRTKTLQSLNDLPEQEKRFLKTEKVTLPNTKYGDIEQNINTFFLNDDLTPNENIIGEFQEGMFYDSPVITIASSKSIEEIGSIIYDSLNLPTEQIQETKPTNKPTGQLSLFDLVDEEINQQYQPSNNSKPTVPKAPEKLTISHETLKAHNLQEGNIFVHEGTPGKIVYEAEGPVLQPLKGRTNKDKVIAAFNVLSSYKALVNAIDELESDETITSYRKELNDKYDHFKILYGTFHERSNIDVLEIDIEGFKLKGLELLNDYNQVVKSDIFTKNIESSVQPKNIQDAIQASLNKYGYVHTEYLSKTLGQPKEQLLKKALEEELLFAEPDINVHSDPTLEYQPTEVFFPSNSIRYVTKDEFLSGPVRFKIAELQKHGKSIEYANDEIIQRSINLLQENDIPTVNIQELDAKFGEHWIPVKFYESFSEELLNTRVSVQRLVSSGGYVVGVSGHSYENWNEYAVNCKNNRRYKGEDLIKFALQGSAPRITYSIKYSDGSSKSFIDREAMSEMQMKISKITDKWREYIFQNEQVGTTLENLYNNTQNIEVEREYDGSHLTFPGLENFEPYEHQRSGVWQAIVQNGCLIDHEVGAGKTLLMACQAMELKRLGIANKTIITALKANTKAIYQDFKKAYPTAKVLYPQDKDFTPKNRVQFFQKIQNNNWDAIIMTHEQFGKIPQSRELMSEILSDEIRNLELDLEEAKRDGRAKQDRRTMNGLQKRIENKQAQIAKLADSLDKDPNLLTFDKMGVDHLIVDESQQFKNLEYTTRHSRVAGLGSPDGSARAFNMLIAVRTMQNIHGADKGVTFCSGTPISNSLIELYLLKKYLRPTELENRSMSNFDSWARSYAELSRDFEIGVTNEVKPKERFRSFQKVPELARFYRSFTNVANQENLKIDKPKIHQNLVEIENTELQKTYSQELISAIQRENFSYFGYHYSDDQMSAKMLLATQISAKISMDMRLLNPSLTLGDGSKIIEAAENIYKNYEKSNDYKGTQLVFCDTGTPKGKAHDIDNFNLYTELKNVLVEQYGIPEHEIQFIHYHDSKTARKNLQEQVNLGNVRIMVGSTTKMGVGVNVQQKVIAMHHLDIPWRPSDFTQRNGRGERQGNIAAKKYNNNQVENYIYATKGTLDAYKYFLVDLKQKFINQIKTKNITSRTIDEGELDEGNMSPAAFIAQLSGKKELLEKNKIDKRISEIELQRSVVYQQKRKMEQDISYAQKTLPKILDYNKLLKADLEIRDRHIFPDNENMYKFNNGNKELSDKKEVTDYLLYEINSTKEEKTIGFIGPFALIANSFTDGKERFFNLKVISMKTDTEYTFGTSKVNIDAPGRIYRYAVDALKGIESKIESQEREHERMTLELDKNQKLLPQIDHTQFDEQLDELKIQSSQLALQIEQQEHDIEKVLAINEKVIELIAERKYSQCSKYLESLDDNERPDIKKLLTDNDLVSEDVRDEALNHFNKQENLTR